MHYPQLMYTFYMTNKITFNESECERIKAHNFVDIKLVICFGIQ